MIHLTFPDGSVRDFHEGITGREIAEGISKSLAKKSVAMAIDGTITDLSDPITRDAAIAAFKQSVADQLGIEAAE